MRKPKNKNLGIIMMKHVLMLVLNYFIIMNLAIIAPSFAGYWLMNWFILQFLDTL